MIGERVEASLPERRRKTIRRRCWRHGNRTALSGLRKAVLATSSPVVTFRLMGWLAAGTRYGRSEPRAPCAYFLSRIWNPDESGPHRRGIEARICVDAK